MLDITILAIGKIKERYFQDAYCEFLKRLNPYIKINIQELAHKSFFNNDQEKIKKEEGKKIIKYLDKYSQKKIIVLADALSDALGVHISEESENHHSEREIWEATISTFVAKFVFAGMFIVPVLLFSLTTAVVFSIVFGLFLIALFSCYLAKIQGINKRGVVTE